LKRRIGTLCYQPSRVPSAVVALKPTQSPWV